LADSTQLDGGNNAKKDDGLLIAQLSSSSTRWFFFVIVVVTERSELTGDAILQVEVACDSHCRLP
jgi:hypothetical protein